MNKTRTVLLSGRCRVAAVLPLLLGTGCGSNPFGLVDYETIGPSLDELQEIETIRLEEQSQTEPVTIEQAAQDALDQLLERTPPPSTAELSLADVRAAALANNLDLKVDLVSPSIAETIVSEEEAKFEATFFGSARHAEDESPTTSLIVEGTETTFDSFDLKALDRFAQGGEPVEPFRISIFEFRVYDLHEYAGNGRAFFNYHQESPF